MHKAFIYEIYGMQEQIFISLWLVIGVVLIVLWIMKLLKQPMIIWYILSGVLLTLLVPSLLQWNTSFQWFANIWIAFLLFMVWMELNPSLIKDIWKRSIITWILQVIITSAIWFLISLWLGFDPITAVYIWTWFSFSSTIVVLKLLSDREEMESTFGRQSIWILIVQDLIVMLVMLLIVSFRDIWWGMWLQVVWLLALKLIWLIFLIVLASKYFIPKITKKIAESQEFLFLFSIGWCFILWALFQYLWFGIEIWALAAWVSLATSSYRFEITSRIKPIKDFFIVIFFVLLGSHVDFSAGINWLHIAVFSTFILLVKPLIIMIILGFMWHTKKNNFLSWASLGQISEFSFILLAMGISSGLIKDPNIQIVATIVGLITIAGSSYFMVYGEKIYNTIRPVLKWIPGPWNQSYKKVNKSGYDIILFGYGRFGSNLYTKLNEKNKILVVDENPSIIWLLQSEHKDCIYGDIGDVEFVQELNVKDVKMVISSVKKFDENIVLLKNIKQKRKNTIVVLVSNHIHEAIKLYEQWADYVILPHYIWVDHTSLMLEEYGFDNEKFMSNKDLEVSKLKDRHQDMMIETLQK